MRRLEVGNLQWAADTVMARGTADIVLLPLEQREHVIPTPAVATSLSPAVIVLREAADIEHAVDRAGTTHHLATRPDVAAAIERRIGLDRIHPVELRVTDALHIGRGGHLDKDGFVGAASFQQQHLIPRISREAIGKHAAGRTGADHDVVPDGAFQGHGVPPLTPPSCPRPASACCRWQSWLRWLGRRPPLPPPVGWQSVSSAREQWRCRGPPGYRRRT